MCTVESPFPSRDSGSVDDRCPDYRVSFSARASSSHPIPGPLLDLATPDGRSGIAPIGNSLYRPSLHRQCPGPAFVRPLAATR
ncbi:hypothetical protein GCM10009609_43350 [Pseudonocardia aurantiaca]